MINYFIKAVKQFGKFGGRARRKEYWYFTLVQFLGTLVFMILAIIVPALIFLYYTWSLVMLIPSISVAVRRMHDTGRSGWYILIPFYNLYLFCIEGQREENAYGPDPKANKDEWDFDRQVEAGK